MGETPGVIAVLDVATVCHLLARPVPGVGIALPVIVPPLSAAAIGLLLSGWITLGWQSAALAYIGGSVRMLIGADLLNLDKVRGPRVPVASIGEAGTFDEIFLTGILAVLIASVFSRLTPSSAPS
jgi:uncharacterized membrane protein